MELSIGTVILLILAVIITMLYNMVIRARLKMDESGSTIDILLNKRFDLITNLVEVVKGYTKYEEDVLSKVVELRNTCHVKPNKNKYNEGLNEAETKLLAVAESYPELKADSLYLELMKQMSDVEEQLQAARRFYNANVTNYNNRVTTFPSALVAKAMKAKTRKYFAAEEDVKANVKVNL